MKKEILTQEQFERYLSSMADCDSLAFHQSEAVLREAFAALLEEIRWIPCSERLPERGEEVLCRSFGGIHFIGMHSDEWYEKQASDSTHDTAFRVSFLQPAFWQPLPAPPFPEAKG